MTDFLSIENNPSLRAINGLHELREVPTNMTIRVNAKLRELNGFNQLRTVGGFFHLTQNPRLRDVVGLDSLRSIQQLFDVIDCDSLQNFSGLGNLRFSGNFDVKNNQLLRDFSGMGNFEQVFGAFTVNNNQFLRDFFGLTKLDSVTQKFEISQNPSLLTLGGLDSLRFIGSFFQITNNDSLQNLTGAPRLLEIKSNFSISQNDQLETVGNLYQLKKVGGFNLYYNSKMRNLEGLNNLEKCTLEASFIGNPALETVHGLQSLRFVGGSLVIDDCDTLENLAGFEKLDSIGGQLWVTKNKNLQAVNLDSLHFLGNSIKIAENQTLPAIHGLHQFKKLAIPELHILDNPNLKKIDAFEQVEHLISCNLRIENNSKLTDLSSFDHLISIGYGLSIINNDGLKTLHGLDNLHFAYNTSEISQNDSLENLSNLGQLKLATSLQIKQNPRLVSLLGMDSLTDCSNLQIIDNQQLMLCDAPGICTLMLKNSCLKTIQNNAPNCNSILEIFNQCGYKFIVSGRAFLDLNCNKIFNAEDLPLDNHFIINSSVFFTKTDSNGFFEKPIFINTQYNLIAAAVPNFTSSPTANIFTTSNVPAAFTDKNFAFCPTTVKHDLRVSLISTAQTVIGESFSLQICVENVGTQLEPTATLTLEMTDTLAANFVEIIDAAGGLVVGKTVTWQLANLEIGSKICFSILLKIVQNAPISAIFKAKSVVSMPIGDNYLPNNTSVLTSIFLEKTAISSVSKMVDKTKIPIGAGFPAQKETLIYTVFFQNSGADTASRVVVLDTISPFLNLATFQILSASHPFVLNVLNNNIFQIDFENINLPDSATNPNASRGFVSFLLTMKNISTLSTKILNRARVQFDQNTGAVTNTVSTEFYNFVATNDLILPENGWFSPNPTSGGLQIDLPEMVGEGSFDVRISDFLGQKIFCKTMDSRKDFLEINDVSSGLFLLEIWKNERRIGVHFKCPFLQNDISRRHPRASI
jgi:uncharacterized repeat protein (TIGR01451 family)